MDGHGELESDVGDVVYVVRPEGPAVAGEKGPVIAAASVRCLLQQGAADAEESSGGIAVVMPSGMRSCRPGEEPDLQVRAGVQLDPLTLP